MHEKSLGKPWHGYDTEQDVIETATEIERLLARMRSESYDEFEEGLRSEVQDRLDLLAYFGRQFGTPADYLTALLWGLTTTTAIDVLAESFGARREPAQRRAAPADDDTTE